MDAAKAYQTLLNDGGKMFMTIAGAMSTAELGLSLAEMIRQDKVHGIAAPGPILRKMFSIWSRTITMSGFPIIVSSRRPKKKRFCSVI